MATPDESADEKKEPQQEGHGGDKPRTPQPPASRDSQKRLVSPAEAEAETETNTKKSRRSTYRDKKADTVAPETDRQRQRQRQAERQATKTESKTMRYFVCADKAGQFILRHRLSTPCRR